MSSVKRSAVSTCFAILLLSIGGDLSAQNLINDGFSGSSLPSHWVQTAGNSSNYTVANGNLNILNADGGYFDGNWTYAQFQTDFIASDSFYVYAKYNYQRADYRMFDFYLYSNHNVPVVWFRIWDSPGKWILVGTRPAGTPASCQMELSTSLTPSDLMVWRSEGVVSLGWGGTKQWECAITDTIESIVFSFAQYSTSVQMQIDSIYAYSPPSEQDSLFVRGGTWILGRDLWKAGVRDLNNDGSLDVAVLEHTTNSVAVLLNNGTGALGTPSYFPCGVRPWALDIGPLNTDSTPDIAIANNPDAVSTAGILFNNGQGVFGSPSSYPCSFRPVSVALADIDRDNDMDMIVANHDNILQFFENDGTGLFHERSRTTISGSPICVRSADLDADADSDLVVLNRWSYDIAILLNNGTGDFQLSGRYPAGSLPEWVSISDFDSDGDLDLAVTCLNKDIMMVYRNDGNAHFDNSVTVVAAQSYQLAEADFDGDGDIDLALANYTGGKVDLFLNNGAASFVLYQSYSMGSGTFSVRSGDFNNDGLPDLVVVNAGSQDIQILLNNRHAAICCRGNSGNVDCDSFDNCDISDLSTLIDNLYISFTPLCCSWEANIDGEGGIDISDLSALIDYLYISFTTPKTCN